MKTLTDRQFLRYLTLLTIYAIALTLAYVVRQELAWIGAGLFLAIALDPGVRWVNKHTPIRRRGGGAGIIAVLGLLIVVFLGSTLVPPVIDQTAGLARSVPGYVQGIQEGTGPIGSQLKKYHLEDKVNQLGRTAGDQLSGKGSSIFAAVHKAFTGVTAVVTILVVSFFALLEGPGWMEKFWKLQPAVGRPRKQAVAAKIYLAISGYVAGNLATSAIAAVVTSLLLLALGVPYAISLGLLVGILDLIPLVGASIAAALVVLVSLFHSVAAAIIMLIFYIVYQQIENHVLQPIIYGKTVEMSPLLVIISIILGAAIGGILGALVAIPIGASIKILVSDYFDHRVV